MNLEITKRWIESGQYTDLLKFGGGTRQRRRLRAEDVGSIWGKLGSFINEKNIMAYKEVFSLTALLMVSVFLIGVILGYLN